jgi:hypothetical protein
MTVTAFWFGNGLAKALNKEVDWDSDTIKVALCSSSFTPAQTMDYFDDITNEVSASGTGYTAGGATLANTSTTYTSGTGVLKLDADDCTWTPSTITARFAVIYKSNGGTAASSPLLGYVNFGADVISTGGPFVITWAASGILTATATIA